MNGCIIKADLSEIHLETLKNKKQRFFLSLYNFPFKSGYYLSFKPCILPLIAFTFLSFQCKQNSPQMTKTVMSFPQLVNDAKAAIL